MKRLGLLAAFLVIGSLAGGLDGSTAAGAAGHPGAHGGGTAAPALPDTVLARVGTDRVITQAAFVEAWRRAAWPSDSLTPAALRRFLDLLVDQELIAAAAVHRTWTWTPAESSGVVALRDRLGLSAALEQTLAEARERRRASGDSLADEGEIGREARAHVVAGLAPAWDEALLGRLAGVFAALPRPTADSSAAAQIRMLGVLPTPAAADTNRTIVRSRVGEYGVRDLVQAWGRLSVAYRPRVETAEQVRELVENGLFERALRSRAASSPLSPAAETMLARAREQIAVAHWLDEALAAEPAPAPRAIAEYFEAHRERWRVPPRARVLRMAAGTRSEATRLALRLRDAAEAESLRVLARRGGLDYTVVVTESSDSTLYRDARRAGPGAVLGPTLADSAWWVTRVLETQPERRPALEEVRREVEREYSAETAETRLRESCRRLRGRVEVRINAVALGLVGERLGQGGVNSGRGVASQAGQP